MVSQEEVAKDDVELTRGSNQSPGLPALSKLTAMLGDPRSPMRQKVELKLAVLDIDELAVKKTSDYLNALIFDTDTKRWTERPCE